MVGITVYWKKFWKKFKEKQPLIEGQELEFREKQLLNEEDSMAFTIEEMMEATQNFTQKTWEGDFGHVFFGKLPDGKRIAVKVLRLESKQAIEGFLTEIDLLSRVHHKNLVSLLGYCIGQSGARMLIYEYMSGGFLSDRLYGQEKCFPGQSAGLSKLNWKSRLKIAIDAAEALQYLHICCTPMIIHRDVKTSNILLDSNLNGKLVDFGLSMMTMDRKAPIEADVAGTAGYLDPEYFITQQFTQKSDVYGFGVVLFEIMSGRHPIDASLPEQEINLIRWVKDEVRIIESPGKIMEMIDKKMDGKYDIKSISSVAKVALRCVEERASGRPSMSEVVGELKQAFMYEKLQMFKCYRCSAHLDFSG